MENTILCPCCGVRFIAVGQPEAIEERVRRYKSVEEVINAHPKKTGYQLGKILAEHLNISLEAAKGRIYRQRPIMEAIAAKQKQAKADKIMADFKQAMEERRVREAAEAATLAVQEPATM